MADDYDRLFLAAQTLHPKAKISGPSALARFLGLDTPQMATNWKKRGVPRGEVVALARKVGCRAEWLATGVGPMTEAGAAAYPASASEPPEIDVRTLKLDALRQAVEAMAREFGVTPIELITGGFREAKEEKVSLVESGTEEPINLPKNARLATSEGKSDQRTRDRRMLKDRRATK